MHKGHRVPSAEAEKPDALDTHPRGLEPFRHLTPHPASKHGSALTPQEEVKEHCGYQHRNHQAEQAEGGEPAQRSTPQQNPDEAGDEYPAKDRFESDWFMPRALPLRIMCKHFYGDQRL